MLSSIRGQLYVCDYEFKVGSFNIISCIIQIVNCLAADIELVEELNLTKMWFCQIKYNQSEESQGIEGVLKEVIIIIGHVI